MVLLLGHYVDDGGGLQHGFVRLHGLSAEHVVCNREGGLLQCYGTRSALSQVPHCCGNPPPRLLVGYSIVAALFILISFFPQPFILYRLFLTFQPMSRNMLPVKTL